MLVIIPTAGIGSRLDFHTKNFNKSMIQLGDTPVISKIIDSYPNNTRFIIITGYKGFHIKEYINLVYPKINFNILNVNIFLLIILNYLDQIFSKMDKLVSKMIDHNNLLSLYILMN